MPRDLALSNGRLLVMFDRQYRIRFLSNTEMLWQRRSLHALQCFASHLISVET